MNSNAGKVPRRNKQKEQLHRLPWAAYNASAVVDICKAVGPAGGLDPTDDRPTHPQAAAEGPSSTELATDVALDGSLADQSQKGADNPLGHPPIDKCPAVVLADQSSLRTPQPSMAH